MVCPTSAAARAALRMTRPAHGALRAPEEDAAGPRRRAWAAMSCGRPQPVSAGRHFQMPDLALEWKVDSFSSILLSLRVVGKWHKNVLKRNNHMDVSVTAAFSSKLGQHGPERHKVWVQGQPAELAVNLTSALQPQPTAARESIDCRRSCSQLPQPASSCNTTWAFYRATQIQEQARGSPRGFHGVPCFSLGY